MKKTKLEQLYSTFLLRRFPLSEGNLRVAEWLAELTEVDRYYASLAESLIMQKPFDVNGLPSIKPLSASLRKLKKEGGVTDELMQEYKDYLSGLNKLAKEIAKQMQELESQV